MTRKEIIEMVDLALKEGKIESFHIYVKPNDNRPCGLFVENEVDEIIEEQKESFYTNKSHFIANEYHMTLNKNHIWLTFKYRLSNENKISELEKKMAELQAQKEKLENGEMEEIC